MKLVFLGTSAAQPTENRGMTCICLVLEKEILMFDAGEGAQVAFHKAKLGWNKKMCNIAKKNLAANGYHSKIINAGYEHIKKVRFDGIVTDLPYGISSKSSESPKKLIRDFVSILPKKKKLALMCKKELADQIELKPAKRYEIYRHKSLTRTILVK